MSNYPPGMSGRDFVRAGIVEPHHHEHEWVGSDPGLIIEDGAAIFSEECRYAEGRYGEGWQCEESRTYRFEERYVWIEGEPNPLPFIEWEDAVMTVEIEDTKGELKVIEADPDPKKGHVLVQYGDIKILYEA